jgi:hypothetical protein
MSVGEPARVHTELERSVYNKMIEMWPWGVRGKVISAIIKLGMEATEKHGALMIGLILRGEVEIRPRSYVPILNTSEDGDA